MPTSFKHYVLEAMLVAAIAWPITIHTSLVDGIVAIAFLYFGICFYLGCLIGSVARHIRPHPLWLVILLANSLLLCFSWSFFIDMLSTLSMASIAVIGWLTFNAAMYWTQHRTTENTHPVAINEY